MIIFFFTKNQNFLGIGHKKWGNPFEKRQEEDQGVKKSKKLESQGSVDRINQMVNRFKTD